MSKITRTLTSIVTILAAALGFTGLSHAQCAVCTLAIVGGLGISRFLGVDDMIVGVWLGAAIFGAAGYGGGLVAKRWPQFKPGKYLFMAVVIAIAAVSLYFADGYVKPYDNGIRCVTTPCPSTSYRLTNLAQGMIIGVICLYLGLYLDKALRRLKNDGGKPYFPFQKVVCPLVMIILGTLAAWFLVG